MEIDKVKQYYKTIEEPTIESEVTNSKLTTQDFKNWLKKHPRDLTENGNEIINTICKNCRERFGVHFEMNCRIGNTKFEPI